MLTCKWVYIYIYTLRALSSRTGLVYISGRMREFRVLGDVFFFWDEDETFRERRYRRLDAYEKTTIP